jgi:hypothetical protein
MTKLQVLRANRLAAMEVLKEHKIMPREFGDSLAYGNETWVFGVDDANAEQASAALKKAHIDTLN